MPVCNINPHGGVSNPKNFELASCIEFIIMALACGRRCMWPSGRIILFPDASISVDIRKWVQRFFFTSSYRKGCWLWEIILVLSGSSWERYRLRLVRDHDGRLLKLENPEILYLSKANSFLGAQSLDQYCHCRIIPRDKMNCSGGNANCFLRVALICQPSCLLPYCQGKPGELAKKQLA